MSSRSRATWSTRARSSTPASTPTPTSTSPRRWTTGICRRLRLARRRAGSQPGRFLLLSFTSDWLYPTREFAPDRRCAVPRRPAGRARRARVDRGTRRLPGGLRAAGADYRDISCALPICLEHRSSIQPAKSAREREGLEIRGHQLIFASFASFAVEYLTDALAPHL